MGIFFLAISVVVRNYDIQLQILNKLSLWNYSCSSCFLWLHVTGEKKRKCVLDKLKPLMVAKYYTTCSTESFYYPSVLMDCTWYYPSLNSLYNHIFIKRKTVGKSELLLNHPNALVTPKQKVLSSSYKSLETVKVTYRSSNMCLLVSSPSIHHQQVEESGHLALWTILADVSWKFLCLSVIFCQAWHCLPCLYQIAKLSVSLQTLNYLNQNSVH